MYYSLNCVFFLSQNVYFQRAKHSPSLIPTDCCDAIERLPITHALIVTQLSWEPWEALFVEVVETRFLS